MPTIKPSVRACIYLVLNFDKNAHLRDGFHHPPINGLISINWSKSNFDHIPWAGNIALTTNFAKRSLHWLSGSTNPKPPIRKLHRKCRPGYLHTHIIITSSYPNKVPNQFLNLQQTGSRKIYHIDERRTWLAIITLPAKDNSVVFQINNFFLSDNIRGANNRSLCIIIPTWQPK